jgi:hypothetical protein
MPDTCKAAHAGLHPLFNKRRRWAQNRFGARKRRMTFSVRRETLLWYSLWARLVTRVQSQLSLAMGLPLSPAMPTASRRSCSRFTRMTSGV